MGRLPSQEHQSLPACAQALSPLLILSWLPQQQVPHPANPQEAPLPSWAKWLLCSLGDGDDENASLHPESALSHEAETTLLLMRKYWKPRQVRRLKVKQPTNGWPGTRCRALWQWLYSVEPEAFVSPCHLLLPFQGVLRTHDWDCGGVGG